MRRTALLLVTLPLAALGACADADGPEASATPAPSSAVAEVPVDAGTREGAVADRPAPGPFVPAQIADVAILFPLGRAPSLAHGYLSASAMGVGCPLLPENVYDAAGGIAGKAQAKAPHASLRVVGVRIDPCFADMAPPANGVGCRNQLRLVFQELTAELDGPVIATDSGLHAFYNMDRTELRALAKELVALRIASEPSGARIGGIGPHPLMVNQGLDGAFAKGVRDLVLAHAGAARLTRVTTLGFVEPGVSWRFAGYDVIDLAKAELAPMAIPTLANDGIEQSFSRGHGSELAGVATPSTVAADDLMALTNVAAAGALDATGRANAFASLLRIEHPAKETPSIIDCVSCHVAEPAKKLVAEPTFGLVATGHPEAFAPDGRWVTDAEMGATFDDDGTLNIHAFSYAGRRPGINQRTVNEAAAITAYLNAYVLPLP